MILIQQSIFEIVAQTSSRQGDAEFSGLFLGFLAIYYLFICLYFLLTIVNAMLVTIAVLDIAKRENEEINKNLWIVLLIIPTVMPILNSLGVLVSLAVSIYYLISYRKDLN
jgi:hypothetical protein